MPVALLMLALSAFIMGTAEFVITGLLTEIAEDLGISISTAGGLISGYALGVVVGGPLFAAAGTRFPRRAMLLASMGLFVCGNFLSAVAAGYWTLMSGRVFAAFGQSAFLGIGAVVAANLVASSMKSRAIALVFTGFTVANVVGVPMGTVVGQHLGWRATFWMIAALGLVSLAGVAALVPAQPPPAGVRLRGELRVFRRIQVWLTLAVAMFSIGALWASFGYITPLLREVTGFSPGALAPLLVLFGIGLVIGNLVGGRLADRAQLATLCGAVGMLAVVLAVLAVLAPFKLPAAVAMLLLGAAGFGVVPAFMARLIEQAGGTSMLASTAGVSATNLGISIGVYFGGLTIAAGLGYTAPTLLGSVMATLGLAVAITAGALEARTRHRLAVDKALVHSTSTPRRSHQ